MRGAVREKGLRVKAEGGEGWRVTGAERLDLITSGTLEVGIRLVWGDSPPLAEPGGGSWREGLGCGSLPKMLVSERSPL